MNANPRVVISILHTFKIRETERCIESIKKSNYDDIKIILSNNGPLKHYEYLKTRFDNIRVINNDVNLGFAKGHNKAVDESKNEDYMFFVNNDLVIDKNTIEELVTAAEQEAGPAIYAPNSWRKADGEKQLEFRAGYVDWYRGQSHSYDGELTDTRDSPDELTQADIDYLHGAALFAPVSVIKKLGGFEEKFFIYYEDTDLCQRAKKRDIKSKPIDSANVTHLRNSRQNNKSMVDLAKYFSLRNQLWFMNRHAPRPQYYVFVAYYFMYVMPRAAAYGLLKEKRLRHTKFVLFSLIAAITFSNYKESTVKETASDELSSINPPE